MVQIEQRLKNTINSTKTTKPFPHVLVVDDVQENVELMEAILLTKGFSVLTARSGPEALELIETKPLDLILLDVMMPGMDGFEVTRRIRANASLPYIPIVLVTALQDNDARVTGLEAGADEFLSKPFSQPELVARSRALVRLKQSYQQLLEIAEENQRLNRLLRTENSRMSQELERTREAQLRLMPQSAPPYRGVSFTAYYNPALEVGGDYYDYFKLDDHRFVVLVGDAVGKGGAAVLGVAITKSLVAAEFSPGLNSGDDQPQAQEGTKFNPANLLSHLNQIMCSTLESSQTEITLWCGMVDLEHRMIHYSNAGHPFPYLCQYRQSENKVIELKQGGLPLGLFLNAEYVNREVSFERGDRLVLYSDGITEGQNHHGSLFSAERLAAVLLEAGGVGPQDLRKKVLATLDSFCEGAPQSDDRTLVVFGFY
ncbi:MAG: SpoIIE family protein phosphatase [Chloroflexi bacterium]|nr:SpoIIE family protein phosphatase [Chloroflexota bacterium]